MNPQAGDTVTSTKSSTTTKTTGARASASAGGRRSATLAAPRASAASRKRRQQPEPPARPRPEANPPPDKLQRRHDTLGGAAHKSRFGDFFSSLASRFRSRTQDAPNDHEDTEKQRIKNNAAEPLEYVKETCNVVESMQSTDNSDSKRRKIEPFDKTNKIGSDSPIALKSPKTPEQPRIASPPSEVASVQDTDRVERIDPGVVASKSKKPDNSDAAPPQDEQRWKVEQVCKNFIDDVCREVWGSDSDSLGMSKEAAPGNKAESAEEAASFIAEEDRASRGSRCSRTLRKDEVPRLRKTIQWLEENARRLREELAAVRSELHEERRAAKMARREYETTMREIKSNEALKYGVIISDLKTRLSQSPSRSITDSSPSSSKSDLLKSENHRREVAALKKRLATAETTIQKLKSTSLDRDRTGRSSKENESNKAGSIEVRKLQAEIQTLRAANKTLEEKLRISEESARARAAELRTQHENHEAQMSSLQKILRSDTIKMIDEIQSKNRIIERLEKMASECAQVNEKLRAKEDETMRKLRESERSHQIRPAPRIEEKIHHDDNVVDLCKVDCEEHDATTELGRLKELAIEQQEVIEVLRQAVKEKERKLDQLSNKRRKEEFYKQWLELEPVAEVEDEDEEGDSALSSAPPSLSPQPGNGGFGANANGVTREAYDNLLFEIEELQTKLLEEKQELSHAKSQVRDLEKALLQETRGSQNSRRALSEKLRIAEEREASLVAEIAELREQNEVLEFRVLELEESPNPRDTPDPADSGIVSPEPIHLYKEHQASKHRDRAVATVMPYTSTYSQPVVSCEAHEGHESQKAPMSLEESGIFEEEVGAEESDSAGASSRPQLSCEATPTEPPAGELLQEVQRLQELRARIQERGANIPPLSPTSDRRSEQDEPAGDSELVAELRERVRQLEERLEAREAERRESKLREEELLDENYRLTENTYCLESELKQLREKISEVRLTSEAGTMTESIAERAGRIYEAALADADDSRPRSECASESQPCADCSELWKECKARIRELIRTEFGLRRQITSLEEREEAALEMLRQGDANWASLETDYELKLQEMSDRLAGQVEVNRSLFEHLTRLNRTADDTYDPPQEARNTAPAEAMEVDGSAPPLGLARRTKEVEESAFRRMSSASSSTSGVSRAGPERLSTISRTRIRVTEANGRDEVDMKVLATETAEPPTEVATEAKEGKPVQPGGDEGSPAAAGEQPEALVSIDRASSDKKVSRLRGSLRRLAGSDALSQWSERRRAVSFERNVIGPAQRSHRLTVYQEICV